MSPLIKESQIDSDACNGVDFDCKFVITEDDLLSLLGIQ